MRVTLDVGFCGGTSLLMMVFMTYVRLSATASVGVASTEEDADGPRRSVRQARSLHFSNEYDWLCPTAMCPPVSPDCSTVEYMVFEYDVMLGNRAVSVRCQTCEYCLDLPFRARRSLFDTLGSSSRRHRCSHLHCPSTPENCEDQRLTDVFLDGHFCKKCPACFDNTVVAVGNGPH